MQVTIVLLAVLACAFAAPPQQEVPILRSTSDVNPDGSFSFGYETGDGTSHDAAGNIEGVQGKFAFVSPEGERFEVTYIANDGGFQPQGAHIPATPPGILRALEYIRNHPPHDA